MKNVSDMDDYRADFPVLSNRDVIYLDSATSTLVPQQVIRAINQFYETNGAVIKRGTY
ncbi:MAG: aminotransferase class V-fold PLP-dependent enzyme, partial [Candidatus Helarchaeota archaeon]